MNNENHFKIKGKEFKIYKQERLSGEVQYNIINQAAQECGTIKCIELDKNIKILQGHFYSKNHFEFDNFNFENYFVFQLIKKGSIKLSFNDNGYKSVYHLKKDDVLISYLEEDLKKTNAYELVATEDLAYLTILINKNYFLRYHHDDNVQKFLYYFENELLEAQSKILRIVQTDIINISNLLFHYSKNKSNSLYIYAKVNEIAASLINLYLKNISLLTKNKEENSVTEKAKKLIEESFHEKDIIRSLPQQLAINRTTLLSKFKKSTGMSLQNYVKKIKLENAYNMLLESDICVSEVSEKVGYLNYSYFSKIFYQKFGIYPSKLRDKM